MRATKARLVSVLELARLHAPPELESASSVYWYGNYGYSGGNRENAFGGGGGGGGSGAW